jgi:hypothetical protein
MVLAGADATPSPCMLGVEVSDTIEPRHASPRVLVAIAAAAELAVSSPLSRAATDPDDTDRG